MPTLEDPNCLFLHSDSFNQDKIYIDILPGPGLQEEYVQEERFLTRTSINREEHFSRYGGEQPAYAYRLGETALALSRILWLCQGDLMAMPEKFGDYWQSYDVEDRPHGIRHRYLTSIYNLDQVLWTHTHTSCELFFSYLACHRHLIAQEANPDDENFATPFGRNRYYGYLRAQTNEEHGGFISFLQTDLNNQPYLPSLQRFYENGGQDQKNHCIIHNFDNELLPFGCLTKGVLVNWLTPKNGYKSLFFHMDDLFHTITGPELPNCETFLRAVFEIQYWYIHIMPCERGSLAVMNMFRYTMLAYYNRKQEDETKRLPMVPTRIDIYPDLEALFLRATMDDFINASIRELYCVDYSAYFAR